MAWRALIVADIQTGLSGQELTGIQQYALQVGQPDPTPSVIAATMDQCRGYVAAKFGGSALGEEGTIPGELIDAAIAIAVWKLATRFPGKLFATPERKTAMEDAISTLKDVARGLFLVEMPTVTTAATTAVVLPSISNCGVRQWVRYEQNEV